MKKKLAIFIVVATLAVSLSSCSSFERWGKSTYSDFSGGLSRTVNIYSLDGKLIRTVKGKMDVQVSDGGKVLFDLNGKRYVYYNCMVEVVEE